MKSGADEAKLLCAYCAAHPTRIVYGEWMGRDRFIGAFKGYDKAALGKLLIFDVYDTAEERFLSEPEWREELSASGLEPYFIKLLAVLDHPTLDDVVAIAKATISYSKERTRSAKAWFARSQDGRTALATQLTVRWCSTSS